MRACNLTIDEHKGTTLVPKIAVVDFEGKRGVWMPDDENKVQFRADSSSASRTRNAIEVLDGVKPKATASSPTAQRSLRNNDTLVLRRTECRRRPGAGGQGGGRRGARRTGRVPQASPAAAARAAAARRGRLPRRAPALSGPPRQ